MLRRLTTAVVLAAAILVAGCSDQPARATGPDQGPSLTIGVNDIRAMIDELVPNQPYQGRAQRAFAKVESAVNSGGTGEAEALAFQQLIVGLLDAGVLQLPDGFDSIDDAVVSLLNTVFRYAGLLHLLHPEAPVEDNVEYVIDVVTSSDYVADPQGVKKALVKTNFGNAALIIKEGDITVPAFAAIIEKKHLEPTYNFPVPSDVQLIGNVFEFSVNSEIKSVGGGTVLSICDEVPNTSGPILLLHDTGNGVERKTPNATGHTCGVDPSQASALRGGTFWARGLNTAGSLAQSVLLPKPAYASHSLAHAIIVDDLSPWSVGESLDKFTVEIVRVKTPGFSTGPTHAVFPKQGALVLWLEIRNHDVVQTCDGGRLLSDVQARPTATSGGGSPTVGTWTNASRCEDVNGTSGWVFEMSNPRNNRNSSGIIDVRITGTPATNQLTYDSNF